ncbi:MAG: hypothetical protein ACK5KR_01630 [Breznakia sp.]
MNSLDYNTLLISYLNNSKFSQLDIFKDIDIVIDPLNGSNNIYLNYQVLHKEEFNNYFTSKSSFFIENLPMYLKKFVAVYNEFHDTYQRKNINSRYAVQLKILYPKACDTEGKRKTFIKLYIKQLIETKEYDYENKKIKPTDLPFVVENITNMKRTVTYALITIIERKYLGTSNYKIYKETKYKDIRTGRFAARTCPKEYKQIVCTKGDIVKDKNGNYIPCKEFFSKNLRVFSFP